MRHRSNLTTSKIQLEKKYADVDTTQSTKKDIEMEKYTYFYTICSPPIIIRHKFKKLGINIIKELINCFLHYTHRVFPAM